MQTIVNEEIDGTQPRQQFRKTTRARTDDQCPPLAKILRHSNPDPRFGLRIKRRAIDAEKPAMPVPLERLQDEARSESVRDARFNDQGALEMARDAPQRPRKGPVPVVETGKTLRDRKSVV